MTTETPDTRISLDRYAGAGEAVVARRLIRQALLRGWKVSVHDGEEWTVKQSTDRMTILAALCTTDNDTLKFRDAAGVCVGNIWLVWGNDPAGQELCADYTDNEAIESLVKLCQC